MKLPSHIRASPKLLAKPVSIPGSTTSVLALQWLSGERQSGMLLVYFSLGPCPYVCTALTSTSMIWSHQHSFIQLLRQRKERIACRPENLTQSDLQGPAVSPFSAHHVPRVMQTWSLGSHPNLHIQLGAQALSTVQRILPKYTGFYTYLFFLFHLFFSPPTSVLAVTENNGFVGGFKMSDRENKHRCSLCSKAGNSIKEAEIKE